MIDDSYVKETVGSVACDLGHVSRIEKLAGDASTRTYYRIFFQDGQTAVAMVSENPGSNEESLFLHIQKYLEDLALPVPKIFSHNLTTGIVILEDLGDNLLESVISSMADYEIFGVYRLALDALLNLQRTTSRSQLRCSAFGLAFDENKLMWEMGFFMDHFVRGWANKEIGESAVLEMTRFFRKICSELSDEPRVFTHRDYHSRNLILKNNRFFMIDFQDARLGPVQYDLASLLRDSYVSLSEKLVEELLKYYMEHADYLVNDDSEHFRRIFDLMSIQRNIKALGTFGYQASIRGSLRYLSSIPRTASNISRNLSKYSEFKDYLPVFEDYVLYPATR
ncbi:MAG: phosphotransferase [Pseudomonadota bacterium]